MRDPVHARVVLRRTALCALVAAATAAFVACDPTTGETPVCPGPDADPDPCATPIDDAGVLPLDVLFPDAGTDAETAAD